MKCYIFVYFVNVDFLFLGSFFKMISILVLFIIFCFIFFIFLFDDFVDNLLFFWIGRILFGGKKGGVIRGLEKL